MDLWIFILTTHTVIKISQEHSSEIWNPLNLNISVGVPATLYVAQASIVIL